MKKSTKQTLEFLASSVIFIFFVLIVAQQSFNSGKEELKRVLLEELSQIETQDCISWGDIQALIIKKSK